MEAPNSFSIPPLGLTPRYIADHTRMQEIIDAFSRYRIASKRIPDEWIQEFVEINSRIKT